MTKSMKIGTLLALALLLFGLGCKKSFTMAAPPLTAEQGTTFLSSLNSLGRMEKVANILKQNSHSVNILDADENTESAKEQDIADSLKRDNCSVNIQSTDQLQSIEINKTKTCLVNTLLKHAKTRTTVAKQEKDTDTVIETLDSDLLLDDPDLSTSNDISQIQFHGKVTSTYENEVNQVSYTKEGSVQGSAYSKNYGSILLTLQHSGTEIFAGANTSGQIQSLLTVQYPKFTARLQIIESAAYANGHAYQARQYYLNGTEINDSQFADYTRRLGMLVGDFADVPTTN